MGVAEGGEVKPAAGGKRESQKGIE